MKVKLSHSKILGGGGIFVYTLSNWSANGLLQVHLKNSGEKVESNQK